MQERVIVRSIFMLGCRDHGSGLFEDRRSSHLFTYGSELGVWTPRWFRCRVGLRA